MKKFDNINVEVGGVAQLQATLTTYTTTNLAINIIDDRNILTLDMMNKENTKYVIKWDYVLGEDIIIPRNCLIEFDGGSISNINDNDYTITGLKTILIHYLYLDDIVKNVRLLGTWERSSVEVKKDNINGMASIYLTDAIDIKELISQDNTIYIIQYDYDLDEKTIEFPDNCVLDFQGGSISNGTLILPDNIEIKAVGKVFGDNINIVNGQNYEWNVKWFGCKSTSTPFEIKFDKIWICKDLESDISLYIQKMYNSGCRNIFIPSGNYYWGKEVNCPCESFSLRGENSNIKFSPLVKYLINVGDENIRCSFKMSGLNIYGQDGNTVAIITGYLNLSNIYNNKITNCGYFINSFAKSWMNELYCIENEIPFDNTVYKKYSGLYYSRIENNEVNKISKACFKCNIDNSIIKENKFSGTSLAIKYKKNKSIEQYKTNPYFYSGEDWGEFIENHVINNYIKSFYVVYNTLPTFSLKSSNNIYDTSIHVFSSDSTRDNVTDEDGTSYPDEYSIQIHDPDTLEIIKYVYPYLDKYVFGYSQYVENVSSINDTFIRINNISFSENDANIYRGKTWNFQGPNSEIPSDLSTAHNLYSDSIEVTIKTNNFVRPVVNGRNNYTNLNITTGTDFYKKNTCSSIFCDVIPRELDMIIGRLLYTQYIIQGNDFDLTSRGIKYINIIGGESDNFYFDKLIADSSMNIFISALDNIVVDEIPTYNIYENRKVIYDGDLYISSYNGFNNTSRLLLPEIINITNPNLNEVLENQDNVWYPQNSPKSIIKNIVDNDSRSPFVNSIPIILKGNNFLDTRCLIRGEESLSIDEKGHPYYSLNLRNPGKVYNLVPGLRYIMLTIMANLDGTIEKGAKAISNEFETTGSVRLINIGGVNNVRDLGGWTNLNGKKVKWQRIYRGGHLNNITSDGEVTLFEELRVKTIINIDPGISNDIRYFSEIGDIEYLEGPNYYIGTIGSGGYTYSSSIERDKTAIRNIFLKLLDVVLKQNTRTLLYPDSVYIHCRAGQHKTGIISILILGLLGVSENDVLKEYDISNMFKYTDSSKFEYAYNYIDELKSVYGGNNFLETVENYLTSCGLKNNFGQIFRSYMLIGEEGIDEEVVNVPESLTMYSFDTLQTNNFISGLPTVLFVGRDNQIGRNMLKYHYIPTDVPITVTKPEYGGSISIVTIGYYDDVNKVYKIEDSNLVDELIRYN